MRIVVAAIFHRILHVDGNLAADDRLQTLITRFFRKLERDEKIVRVRDGDSRLSIRHRLGHDFLEGKRPLKQGISGMNPQVDETRRFELFARSFAGCSHLAHYTILSF